MTPAGAPRPFLFSFLSHAAQLDPRTWKTRGAVPLPLLKKKVEPGLPGLGPARRESESIDLIAGPKETSMTRHNSIARLSLALLAVYEHPLVVRQMMPAEDQRLHRIDREPR